MATKSSKRTSRMMETSQTSTASSQASTSTPGSRSRPGSPLSPTRTSRLQEKTELQNLNNRLATYIDRVRQLEQENGKLVRQIQSFEETSTRQEANLKSVYEQELAQTRLSLDSISKEKAKLEIDTKRLFEENDNLKNRLEKTKKDLVTADRNASLYEARYNDANTKYNQAIQEKKKLQDDIKDQDKLLKQLDDVRKHLAEETLLRVDMENKLLSMKEDMEFRETVYNNQLQETRVTRQVEISEIDGRLSEEYEAKLQSSLQELRDQYEEQILANKLEVEYLYESKVKNLQAQAQKNSGANASLTDELRQSQSQIDLLHSRVSELEAASASSAARIHELERLLDGERRKLAGEREKHREELNSLELDLNGLRDEMTRQLQEYQDLLDIKVALDMEIAAYRKLLESEEERLHISPHSSWSVSEAGTSSATPRSGFGIGGGKRKRHLMESSDTTETVDIKTSKSCKGDIEITEADPKGRFIKLHNKSDKEVSLGGWQLIRRASGRETVYKFHRTVKLDAGSSLTVWSSDQGESHEPPHSLVMKTQWCTGDVITTQLLNNSNKEVAEMTNKLQTVSHSSSRHVQSSSRSREGREQMYHQQGDPQGEERCRIM